MARIRTVKPEFWTDEKIVELSFEARLFFIGLWNYADDYGILEWSPKRIKMQLFPADNINIIELLHELHVAGLIIVYTESQLIPPNLSEYERALYFKVCGWDKHQKVDKRAPLKRPLPPGSAESQPRIKEGNGSRKGMDQSRFPEFWTEYRRKEGKQKAEQAWEKNNLDSIADEIIADAKARNEKFEQWKDPKFIPHASTYLNQRRWEDQWQADSTPQTKTFKAFPDER